MDDQHFAFGTLATEPAPAPRDEVDDFASHCDEDAAREDEGCGADGCTSFGGCAVCGSEAEFEADPEAHIAANDAMLAGHVVEHQPPSAAEGAA